MERDERLNLLPKFFQRGFQRCNLLNGVAALLALQSNNGLGGVGHKALVGQLLFHAGKEFLLVFKSLLLLFNFG